MKKYRQSFANTKKFIKGHKIWYEHSFSMGFALLLKARGFEFVNASIHPLSPATKEELNTRFDEAKELIKTIEKETGIKL